jgi:pilus assembly protein CpaF
MMHVDIRFEDGSRRAEQWPIPLTIGRDRSNQFVVASWRVARHHAALRIADSHIMIEDFGALSGTWVNGRRITHYGPLKENDEIIIGPCLITIRALPGVADKADTSIDATEIPVVPTASTEIIPPIRHGDQDAPTTAVATSAVVAATPVGPDSLRHRRRLHGLLVNALDLRRRDITEMTDDALRAEATGVMSQLLATDEQLPETLNKDELRDQVVNEAVGLGPLEPLLADAAISEIMVNRHDEIFVEQSGRLCRAPVAFSSESAVLGVIERIVAPLGRRIDESSPMVDARLRDGSRVNAVIGPVALRGASLTIRKFPRRRLQLHDLQQAGALSPPMAQFLTSCVRHRRNIVVSGGTGSGKTTLLNVLSNAIPSGERIITIEDAAELRLNHSHLVALESRPANAEGQGFIGIRELVRNALRMRPDRIVVGECRGAEAFDMLAAMNTGHEGSLTTLHANTPRDALSRLETMILMAGMDLPLAAVREHIAASIQFIVQQARLACGQRVITGIVEVTGIESGRIQTQPVFLYHGAPAPRFAGCGVAPDCLAGSVQAGEFEAGFFDQAHDAVAGSFRPGDLA